MIGFIYQGSNIGVSGNFGFSNVGEAIQGDFMGLLERLEAKRIELSTVTSRQIPVVVKAATEGILEELAKNGKISIRDFVGVPLNHNTLSGRECEVLPSNSDLYGNKVLCDNVLRQIKHDFVSAGFKLFYRTYDGEGSLRIHAFELWTPDYFETQKDLFVQDAIFQLESNDEIIVHSLAEPRKGFVLKEEGRKLFLVTTGLSNLNINSLSNNILIQKI